MRRRIFWILLGTCLFGVGAIPFTIQAFFNSSEENESVEQELLSIDNEIASLEKQRNFHEASAYRRDEEADRWQFESGKLPDARRSWNLAEKDRAVAQELQVKIDLLETRKEEILEKYPKYR